MHSGNVLGKIQWPLVLHFQGVQWKYIAAVIVVSIVMLYRKYSGKGVVRAPGALKKKLEATVNFTKYSPKQTIGHYESFFQVIT